MAATRSRFFRVHLQTAVLLSLAAGALLFVNTRPCELSDDANDDDVVYFMMLCYRNRMYATIEGFTVPEPVQFGWPSVALRKQYASVLDRQTTLWIRSGVAIDVAVALGICFAVMILSEFLARRRHKVRPVLAAHVLDNPPPGG